MGNIVSGTNKKTSGSPSHNKRKRSSSFSNDKNVELLSQALRIAHKNNIDNLSISHALLTTSKKMKKELDVTDKEKISQLFKKHTSTQHPESVTISFLKSKSTKLYNNANAADRFVYLDLLLNEHNCPEQFKKPNFKNYFIKPEMTLENLFEIQPWSHNDPPLDEREFYEPIWKVLEIGININELDENEVKKYGDLLREIMTQYQKTECLEKLKSNKYFPRELLDYPEFREKFIKSNTSFGWYLTFFYNMKKQSETKFSESEFKQWKNEIQDNGKTNEVNFYEELIESMREVLYESTNTSRGIKKRKSKLKSKKKTEINKNKKTKKH